MDEPEFDADGYPTDRTLEEVEHWPIERGFDRLLAFVQRAWRYEPYFHRTQRRYYVSTAGWSGNESLMGALGRNYIFWAVCFIQERKGGHFIFEVPPLARKGKEES